MAVPTSIPSTAASPPNIAPAKRHIIVKHKSAENMAAISPNTAAPISVIGPTRNWVIPPRPKPGRKPATDTPPTKRKAQNRAAQRAFRERRAARVGELEVQLKETEEDQQKRGNKMQDQIVQQTDEISRLEEDVQRLNKEVNIWRERYYKLQQNFEHERDQKYTAQVELAYLRNGTRATGTSAVPLPPRRQQPANRTNPVSLPIDGAHNDHAGQSMGCGGCTPTSCACAETAMTLAASGCGKCTADGKCECLDATLEGTDLFKFSETNHKRPHSTRPESVDIKRPRFSTEHPQQREIDFTAQFSYPNPIPLGHISPEGHHVNLEPQERGESCGFCAEGTYCACAEAEGPLHYPNETDDENRLAPLLYSFTPPPSDTDVTLLEGSFSKIPPLHPNHRIHHSMHLDDGRMPNMPSVYDSSNQVPMLGQELPVGGPGSCDQCQKDPRSGLFCRSLAAMRASNGSNRQPRDQCCGVGNTPGGGCCRQGEDLPSVTLSCAEAYKTLATHKNFEKASYALDDWLPKLQASVPHNPTRAALDIEAASVMHVIKYFDVRFGRD